MSQADQASQDTAAAAEQNSNADDQTLTYDGKVYAMASLPPEAINVVNDLLRSENELDEFRFRMRQISAAQQGLMVSLGQIIQSADIQPISETEEFKSWTGEDSAADQEAA